MPCCSFVQNSSFFYNWMLTNFDPFPFFRYFLGRRLVRETSVIIVSFRRPVFKDVNSWICSVISFCKSVMATNKLDMMLVSLISSLFLLLCHIPPCPQIGSSAIDQILPPHSTGEGPGLHFLYSSGCCYRV